MTLAELSDYICTKVGQSDDASAAACKLFLRRRYQMIWDYALWKESLFVVPFSAIPSSSPGYTIGVLPPSVNQVVAIRPLADGRSVPELDQTTLMRCDPGEFTRTGANAIGFSFLSPTCVDFPPGTADGIFVSRLLFSSSSILDTTELIHVVGEEINGRELRETLALTGPTPVSTDQFYTNPCSISLSAACAGTITITDASGSTTPPLATLYPGELALAQRPRVRLFEAGAGGYYALAKRCFLDLLDDSATPTLRNSENALIAFAIGDLLERQRQYAKAQLKLQEGEAQLQLLLDLEKNQSANEQRIIPAEIHGAWGDASPVFAAGGKGWW